MNQLSMSSAYMWSAVIMIVFFLLAVLISNMILFKPRDPGTTKRRLWFWILCVATGVVAFVVNFIIGNTSNVPAIQSEYHMNAAIAAVGAVVIYILAGFLTSKLFPSSKVGTWFN